jgi:hypothetical protein
VALLTSKQINQYAEEFSRDPGFIKVEPKGRDRETYVYRLLMSSADYFDCLDIAQRGWTLSEARLVPRLLDLRAQGIAKTKCAAELGVSLGQVNRWLAEPS